MNWISVEDGKHLKETRKVESHMENGVDERPPPQEKLAVLKSFQVLHAGERVLRASQNPLNF